jgi:hypothetical protein
MQLISPQGKPPPFAASLLIFRSAVQLIFCFYDHLLIAARLSAPLAAGNPPQPSRP